MINSDLIQSVTDVSNEFKEYLSPNSGLKEKNPHSFVTFMLGYDTNEP